MFKSLRDKLPSRNSATASKLSDTELNADYGIDQFPEPIKDMNFPRPNDRNKANDLYICKCFDPKDEIEDVPLETLASTVGENQKSVIMELLNQLKFGADLTKISMPIFVLETKSLLEMFADYMAHPNIFLKVCNAPDRKSRMFFIAVWYITVFHAGNKDIIAKKPYNSVIGETFHCSWRINDEDFNASESSIFTETPILDKEKVRIGFMAEQLSHHPPITGFLFTCPQKKVTMSGVVNTKPKFKASTICVDFSGDIELKLTIDNKEEIYNFTLPTAYVRSILSTPYIELCGDISIKSTTNNFTGKINFIGKSLMKNNGLHKISGHIEDLESHDKSPFISINGTWNESIEVYSPDINLKYSIDVKKLKIYKKWLTPLKDQVPEESRRVWQEVTTAILKDDTEKATQLKKEIEEKQRLSERVRMEKRLNFPARHFIPQGNGTWKLRTNYQETESSPSLTSGIL